MLLCRDIELACDEKVIKKLDMQQRADYSQALLACSVSRRSIAACPLAFGEIGVKERVKGVLHYKKSAFWIVLVAFVLSLLVALCFLTDPYQEKIRLNGRIYERVGSSIYELPEGSEEQGFIIGSVHRTSENPKEDLYASNLHEKYVGCPIYMIGSDYNRIYLYDYSGFYIPFEAEYIKIKNPWVGDYIPGVANNLGNVNKDQYESISKDFLIGANRYGQAVFQDPHKAFYTFVVLYREAIEEIRETYSLEPISAKDYDSYKKYGWQTTSGSVGIQKQVLFVSSFLDIYENSFINEVGDSRNELATTELVKLSLWIGGAGVDSEPMYIYLMAKDGSDTSVDIREGDVENYIEERKNNPVVTDSTTIGQSQGS